MFLRRLEIIFCIRQLGLPIQSGRLTGYHFYQRLERLIGGLCLSLHQQQLHNRRLPLGITGIDFDRLLVQRQGRVHIVRAQQRHVAAQLEHLMLHRRVRRDLVQQHQCLLTVASACTRTRLLQQRRCVVRLRLQRGIKVGLKFVVLLLALPSHGQHRLESRLPGSAGQLLVGVLRRQLAVLPLQQQGVGQGRYHLLRGVAQLLGFFVFSFCPGHVSAGLQSLAQQETCACRIRAFLQCIF